MSRAAAKSSSGTATVPARPKKVESVQQEALSSQKAGAFDSSGPESYVNNQHSQEVAPESMVFSRNTGLGSNGLPAPFVPFHSMESASARISTAGAVQRAVRTKIREDAAKQPKTKERATASEVSGVQLS